MFSFFKNTIRDDIVLIDSIFPQEKPMGFRNYEINYLMDSIEGCKSYTMYPMKPGKDAWFKHGYGMEKGVFDNNLKKYLHFYPENEGKIFLLNKKNKYKFRLAYSHFLAETFTLLPFFNKNKIPFIFILYPGGAFGLNNKSSDKMLRKIFSSPYFLKVITTQEVTKNYIINKKLCPEEKVEFIFGGISQFRIEDSIKKKLYKVDKDTFDICFVAFKYSDKGVDKGYDLFIEAARRLANQYPDMHFHVVGGFDESEIDVSDIKSQINFYGPRQPNFLRDFYSKMDICLSPNRPYKLYEGNFDGFPLGAECMFLGTALFTTDELMNNNEYFDDDEIIIIKPEAEDITLKIKEYYLNTNKLYSLSKRGQLKVNKLMNPDNVLKKISEIIMESAESCRKIG
ncbi:MAG: glycosyltransferase family 4 protein [Rhodospirillaceae bacterium]|nr:glycosyltransferase family 4 protein [Rhodospirillaceae bacterium]